MPKSTARLRSGRDPRRAVGDKQETGATVHKLQPLAIMAAVALLIAGCGTGATGLASAPQTTQDTDAATEIPPPVATTAPAKPSRTTVTKRPPAKTVTKAPPGPKATVTADGTYLVGTDIQPGTYRAKGGSSCYWARLSGLAGDFDDILANNVGGGSQIVTIKPSDKGFHTERCGTWRKVAGTSPSAAASRDGQSPQEVVAAYFDAINREDYKAAYALGGSNLDSSYQHFAAGFATTARDQWQVTKVAGSKVSGVLTATQTDGSVKTFSGYYVVSGGKIADAHLQQA